MNTQNNSQPTSTPTPNTVTTKSIILKLREEKETQISKEVNEKLEFIKNRLHDVASCTPYGYGMSVIVNGLNVLLNNVPLTLDWTFTDTPCSPYHTRLVAVFSERLADLLLAEEFACDAFDGGPNNTNVFYIE